LGDIGSVMSELWKKQKQTCLGLSTMSEFIETMNSQAMSISLVLIH
jgi:hypothetical protein